MKVKINGKYEEVGSTLNITGLLISKGLSCERVVVEHNRRIIPKEEIGAIALKEDDDLEIVSFVGGG